MMSQPPGLALAVAAISFLSTAATIVLPAQPPSDSPVIRQVDSAVAARLVNVVGYTVTEHYAVLRGKDQAQPVAEMTVETTYNKDSGKTYTILSQNGSEIVRRLVLGAILDNEKTINLPGNREGAWITSANYEMKMSPAGSQQVDGRDCLVLAIAPRRKAPYLIEGTLWVDSKDGSIVQIKGTSSRSPSVFTGPTQLMRQYANVNGFAMATHARAVSNSFLLGETIVTIDYQDYKMQLRPAG